MSLRLGNVGNDSSCDDFDPSEKTNEPAFSCPVGGLRKLRPFLTKSRHKPDGNLFRVSPASVIRQGFNRPTKGSGLTTCCRGQMATLPSRVKEFEMKVNGVLPVEPKKANSEGEKRKAWLHTESRPIDSMRNLSQRREGKSLLPPPESIETKTVQTELNLKPRKRICSKCKVNEVYLDIPTQDFCEPCLYELVQNQ